jgi:hypothetical protein
VKETEKNLCETKLGDLQAHHSELKSMSTDLKGELKQQQHHMSEVNYYQHCTPLIHPSLPIISYLHVIVNSTKESLGN